MKSRANTTVVDRLSHALIENNCESVKNILCSGELEINSKIFGSETILAYVISHPFFSDKIFDVLLECGIDINLKWENYSYLWLAIHFSNYRAARKLLDFGIRLNRDESASPIQQLIDKYEDKKGNPLSAKDDCLIGLIKKLIENGADTNWYYVQPFHGYKIYILYSAIKSNLPAQTIQLLLDFGANPLSLSTQEEITPLQLALQSGRDDVCSMLQHAIKRPKKEKPELISDVPERLMQSIEENDVSTATILLSILKQQKQIEERLQYLGVKSLTDIKPIVSMKNQRNVPVLVLAINKGMINVLALLLQLGADPDCKFNGCTPLMFSASSNNHSVECTKLLLGYGCDINAIDSSGWSALHFACKAGNAELVALLLKSGAKQTARGDAATPWEIAREYNRDELLPLLDKPSPLHQNSLFKEKDKNPVSISSSSECRTNIVSKRDFPK